MIQLFIHLLGDYFLQNDWMATNKGKYTSEGWAACSIHCFLYSVPFFLYYNLNVPIYLLVFATHFLIDKFGLARYITKLINWNWEADYGGKYYVHDLGFNEGRPEYLAVWIHIIRDNSLHLFCNYLIIQYFI